MKVLREIKPVEYYLQLNYPITIYRAEEGGYVAEIEDLPGCITEGESLEEVTRRIEDARHAWIQVAYEDGVEIPLPRTETEYSGKFMVRIPRYLHRRLAEQAAREGVSLNQYVESILSAGASTRSVFEEIKAALEGVQRGVVAHSFPFICYPAGHTIVRWETEETEHEPFVCKFGKTEDREEVAVWAP